jgi:hypothetical protein
MITRKPFHPLILVIFPTLSFLMYNAATTNMSTAWRTVLIIELSAVMIWLILSLIVRNVKFSALIVSIAGICFFSCGHVVRFFEALFGRPMSFVGNILIWACLCIMGIGILIYSKGRFLDTATGLLNLMSLFLLLFLIPPGLRAPSKSMVHYAPPPTPERDTATEKTRKHKSVMPHIYYIILDGYGRDDVLRRLYGMDNTPFIRALEKMRFYIPRQSSANYSQTALSLTSSLNMSLLEDLPLKMDPKSDDRTALTNLMAENKISTVLKKRGYRRVCYTTGVYEWAFAFNTDVHPVKGRKFTEFEQQIISFTPLGDNRVLDSTFNQYEAHRKQIQYVIEHIPDTATDECSTYTFAHILAPHPPFVFDSSGKAVNPNTPFGLGDGRQGKSEKDYADKYRQQLTFLNTKLLEMVRSILDKCIIPPVIILQADHGPGLYWARADEKGFSERMPIFNAYHVSDECKKQLYETVTPVNTFPIILNCYFKTKIRPRPNKSYYSTWKKPFDFIDVTDRSPFTDKKDKGK